MREALGVALLCAGLWLEHAVVAHQLPDRRHEGVGVAKTTR